MKKSIAKRAVIKALETEPLIRGQFFSDRKDASEAELTKPGCRVCAVGAVLRHMSFETAARKLNANLFNLGVIATRYYYGDGCSWRAALYDQNYLGALSIFYEEGNSRRRCISFVKRYFPAVLTLSLTKKEINNRA